MPSEIRNRKFCSQACVGASRRKVRKKEWVTIECKQCGKSFEVTPAWARNGRRKYCSRTCHAKAGIAGSRLGVRHTKKSRERMSEAAKKAARSGENSSQWKGGRFTDKNGYVYVMVDRLQSPTREIAAQMTKTRYILEHRAVKAADVGRPLLRTEQVHHVNGVKNDNRLENLSILDSRKHSLKHRTLERKYSAALKRIEELEMKLEGLRSAPT
jgi:hypothetical protein